MKRVVSVLAVTLIIAIGCSLVSSKSDQNKIIGTLTNESGVPVQNMDIHALHIADTPTRSVELENLGAYPNPFSNLTTIAYNISETELQYVLKVINLETKEEITIIDENKKKGSYSVAMDFQEHDLPHGIYRVYDNHGNEVDIFYAPMVKTKMNFKEMSRPNTAGSVSGYLIGQTVTTTDNDGKFSFAKDELFLLDEPHTLIRTDETGLQLAKFSLSSKVNIVAYFDENRYAFKEIDLKQNKSYNLELIIYN